MRKVLVLSVGALLLGPIAARGQAAKDDPDKKVAGGVMVKGWEGRTDRPNQKLEDVKFEEMGGGFHITGGPHAIFWNPANTASGNYTVKATLSKTQSTPHAESYGLFIAGSKLKEAEQNYLYCVVFGNGMYSVVHRAGAETHPLVSRKADDAVAKASDKGTAKDDIAMSVTPEKVSCSINGKEVWSAPRADVIGAGKLPSTDGIYGLRASHNLSIHVSNFGVTKN